ncbi:MAG TPA: LLM class flavin-dependent oxidoreductase [Acidimicrobiales bacterium]|nr:LLM class flavin-dependent oxidoreductase [Acidimicrobiales bacterium]
MFSMRFAMRATTGSSTERADLYGAVLDMCGWAEGRGCLAAVVSEHHGSEDGYLPSPVPLAAAIAARTSTLPINVAALMLAFYEPVKLAEDMAIVDLVSRGRVSYVIGIGYRDEEFAMFGVERRGRGVLVERRLQVLKRLLAGEEVDVDGRRVRITPVPFTPGGPFIAYGGGTEAAARRAGRLGMVFLAETYNSSLEGAYRAAAAEAGQAAPGCMFPRPGNPATVFVAEDPDRAWAEIGEYLLVDAVGYGKWNAGRTGVASVSFATSVEELKAERGEYRIMTPSDAAAHIAEHGALYLQPLAGGIPPDVAWRYLETAADVKEPST